MTTYKIKISGEGTQQHIIHSLLELVRKLQGSTPKELQKATFDDSVLQTEIGTDEKLD